MIFYLIVSEAELKKALTDVEKIKEFLFSIKLTLHPKKRYIQKVTHGVPFLGMVVYPNAIVPSRRFKNNFYRAALSYSMELNSDESILAYLGYMKNVDGKKLCSKVFDAFGFEYRF